MSFQGRPSPGGTSDAFGSAFSRQLEGPSSLDFLHPLERNTGWQNKWGCLNLNVERMDNPAALHQGLRY
jgi:hypothetical protein